jgi:hypothetical protein
MFSQRQLPVFRRMPPITPAPCAYRNPGRIRARYRVDFEILSGRRHAHQRLSNGHRRFAVAVAAPQLNAAN